MDSEMDAAFQVVAFVVISAGGVEGGEERKERAYTQGRDNSDVMPQQASTSFCHNLSSL